MLDIFDGLHTIEMGLAQGVEYQYLNANRIQGRTACAPDLLGYSRPKQENIIEGLAGSDTHSNRETTKTIAQLEAEFATTLTTYTTKHALFMNEMKNNSDMQQKTNPFYDTIVEVSGSTFDFSYAYINKYGYKHKYQNAASWDAKNANCPTTTQLLTEASYNSIGRIAADMSSGQPCIAGELITDASNTKYAWVDIKGVKHNFTDISKATWHNTCSTITASLIIPTASGYDKIPTGDNMTATDACRITYVSSELETELAALNTKLTTLARQINKKRETDISANRHLGLSQSQHWTTFKDNASRFYSSIVRTPRSNATLDAKEESSGLFATSNQMHFYVWLSFIIILIWYLLRVIYKRTTTIYDADSLTLFNWQNAIILVSCIWILSTVWKWRPAWMREEWYTIPAWLR